jgi:hypothetical protein
MSNDAVVAVIDALERLHVPYMLVGSLAVNLYAAPRSTQDADFVVEADATDWDGLKKALGDEFRWEAQLAFEAVTATQRRFVDYAETAFAFEFFSLSNDEHDQSRFARRTRVRVLGRDAWVATAEDVIITKLRWSRQGNRSKDISDVRAIIALNGSTIDWGYVEPWCDRHGTRKMLDELR